MNKILAEKLKSLPASPGVYFHKSATGEVLYVGKAAVLKNRVRQYFQSSRYIDIKTKALVDEIADTDWLETESEVDALFLESEMVKRYLPRYNVLLRDDKSQLFIRIPMKEKWPTVTFTRNPADDGAEYYGPFYNGYALRKALRYLRRAFPYFTTTPKPGDSKLNQQIGIVPLPTDDSAVYKADLKKLISYIKGNRKALIKDLEYDMKQAASRHDFERAAFVRNQLRHMQELQRRVMFGDREFLDISKDKALADIQQLMGIDQPLARIECYDVSHMSGKQVVGSMVVFTNGVSDRAEYRKFKLTERNDDYKNIQDMLQRRLSVKNLHQWTKPQLIIIDGGKGQLTAAIEAASVAGVHIPMISIAKREEEIIIHKTDSNIDTEVIAQIAKDSGDDIMLHRDGDFVTLNLHPGQYNAGAHSKNLRLSKRPYHYDDVTKLLQRIRDESHRFAISYHSSLKRGAATKSTLQDIPGVGPVTQKKLLRKFGSVAGLGRATEEQIAAVVGVMRARVIKQHLVD